MARLIGRGKGERGRSFTLRLLLRHQRGHDVGCAGRCGRAVSGTGQRTLATRRAWLQAPKTSRAAWSNFRHEDRRAHYAEPPASVVSFPDSDGPLIEPAFAKHTPTKSRSVRAFGGSRREGASRFEGPCAFP